MLKRTLLAFAAIAAIPFMSVGTAHAFPLGSTAHKFSGFGSSSRPPIQFQIFCLKNPSECRNSVQKVAAAKPSVMRTLMMVNSAVNREIRPRREASDVWSISSSYGDCDDYVMTKRHRLIKMGIPTSALRVAVVRTQSGEGHAVLIVKTTSGEYVLDNLRKSIVKRGQTGYRYLKVETGNQNVWS